MTRDEGMSFMRRLKDLHHVLHIGAADLEDFGDLFVLYTRGRFADLVDKINFDTIAKMDGIGLKPLTMACTNASH